MSLNPEKEFIVSFSEETRARATNGRHAPFGDDPFGRGAERVARFFGTPKYLIGQTLIVIAWIVVNAIGISLGWDPYPFILLNLAFSTQAAYAAPLILLAQTRQAERDKMHNDAVEQRHTVLEEALKTQTDRLTSLLVSNTELTRQDKEVTEQVAALTREIHALLLAANGSSGAGAQVG
jgi:uncharacterized membrane protein